MSKKTQNLDKIPFNLEDEQDLSPEIQVSIQKSYMDNWVQTEKNEKLKDESIQINIINDVQEETTQTSNKELQLTKSSQVNILLSNMSVSLQADLRSESMEKFLQTEETKLIQDSKEIQTEQNSKLIERNIQISPNMQEEFLQTDFVGKTKWQQTELQMLECEIQTVEEEKKIYQSEVEVQWEFIKTSNLIDSYVQTIPDLKLEPKDISTQIQFNVPMSTSFTQTIEEKSKKTRTGGVQVCIGNRMHLRQIKLARILMLRITNESKILENDKIILATSLTKWKTIINSFKSQNSLPRKSLFTFLNTLFQKQNLNNKKTFFEKLKDNTIKWMMYDQEKAAERHEKYVELEEAIKALMRQNEILQNKQLYYEDFIEKKEHDLKLKKTELWNANK